MSTKPLTEEQQKANRKRAKEWYRDPINKEKQLKRQREYYIENKDKVNTRNKASHKRRHKEGKTIGGWVNNKYSGIPCMDCGHTYKFYIMDFDHRPEESKSFGIGEMNRIPTRPESIALVEKEISKCDLVCSNCHRERTFSRYQ